MWLSMINKMKFTDKCEKILQVLIVTKKVLFQRNYDSFHMKALNLESSIMTIRQTNICQISSEELLFEAKVSFS